MFPSILDTPRVRPADAHSVLPSNSFPHLVSVISTPPAHHTGILLALNLPTPCQASDTIPTVTLSSRHGALSRCSRRPHLFCFLFRCLPTVILAPTHFLRISLLDPALLLDFPVTASLLSYSPIGSPCSVAATCPEHRIHSAGLYFFYVRLACVVDDPSVISRYWLITMTLSFVFSMIVLSLRPHPLPSLHQSTRNLLSIATPIKRKPPHHST